MIENQYFSEPEHASVSRIPKNKKIRHAFYGPTPDEMRVESVGQDYERHHLRMPPVAETDLVLRSNGPCIRCQMFLRKLVRLAQEENTDILGILVRSPHGHDILDIHSDRTREILGDVYQSLLDELASSDNTHGKHNEYHQPCSQPCPNQEQYVNLV